MAGDKHTAIHLGASIFCIPTIRIADESKALGPLGFPVPGKEDSGDTTETLEEIPQLVLFCQLADLLVKKLASSHNKHREPPVSAGRQKTKTYVCNSQSRQIVLLEATAHLLATASTALPHVRRHVAGVSSTKTTLVLLGLGTASTSSGLLDGGHGVLERTTSCEMLSTANTTLDLLVLELVLHTALFALLFLLLRVCLPVHRRAEGDVLAYGGGVKGRTRGVALLESELLPFAAFGDLRVDIFTDDGSLDSASNLHFLIIVVKAVGDDGLGAILVRDHLLRGERGGVIEFLVVSPVGAASKNVLLEQNLRRESGLGTLTSRVETFCVLWWVAAAAEFLDFSQRRIRCGFDNLLWRGCGW